MNVLADELKRINEEGISEGERELRKAHFNGYYYYLRDIVDSKFYSNLTVEQRQKIHGLILAIYILKNHLGGFSYEIINNKREETERPVIFAITHVGKYDIEVCSEALKDHYYLLSGDFEHIEGIVDAPFLGFNGVIYFKEDDKEDRHLATEKMIEVSKDGGNLMYFPEGTWNLKGNLPVLPLYWGIIDVARKGNAIIVPVACDQYGKHFKINIGANFDVLNYPDNVDGKTDAINDLRDALATLKWDIWETEKVSRSDLTGREWEEYINARFQEWDGFNEEYVEGLIYKPKGVTSEEEVYAPVKKLVPNKDNAFLFKK